MNISLTLGCLGSFLADFDKPTRIGRPAEDFDAEAEGALDAAERVDAAGEDDGALYERVNWEDVEDCDVVSALILELEELYASSSSSSSKVTS